MIFGVWGVLWVFCYLPLNPKYGFGQGTAKINFLMFQGEGPGCCVWGRVTWGWSSVVDGLQEQKGIEVASSCALQCCAKIRLKHKRQEWRWYPGNIPFCCCCRTGECRFTEQEILETQPNQGKEKKKKKESCVSRIYYSWQLVTTFLLHCLMTPRHFTPLLPFPEFPVSYWCLVVHRQGSKELWFKTDGLF